MKTRIAFLSAILPLSTWVAAQTFEEFPIPTANSDAVGIASGPDGTLWFTQFNPGIHGIARITGAGAVTEFPGAGVNRPVGIVTGPDGALWYTVSGDDANQIGRIESDGGGFSSIAIPTARSRPDGIALGPDGAIWFTEVLGNRIGRLVPGGGVTEFVIPTPDSRPEGIIAGPDGAVWFTESAGNKIGRVTPAGAISEFSIPTPNSRPQGIAAGADGALWFTESLGNRIGRVTTQGAMSEFPLPTASATPFAMTAGPDGAVWFIESSASALGRIAMDGAIVETPVPTGGAFGGVAQGPTGALQGIVTGPDGAIWFVETGANKIGRLSLGPATCASAARTMCLNNSRFRVTAHWRKPDGSTGDGQAVPLTSDSGYFWFFNSANIELVVKVLWVFGAGLTNVEVTLDVLDTQSGSARTYLNSLGTAFQPIQDTTAFDTCP